jgi:hypothetical protein
MTKSDIAGCLMLAAMWGFAASLVLIGSGGCEPAAEPSPPSWRPSPALSNGVRRPQPEPPLLPLPFDRRN